MSTQTIAEIVSGLSKEEEQAVRQFVEYLRQKQTLSCNGSERSRFLSAAEDFMSQHPELLSRLAR